MRKVLSTFVPDVVHVVSKNLARKTSSQCGKSHVECLVPLRRGNHFDSGALDDSVDGDDVVVFCDELIPHEVCSCV